MNMIVVNMMYLWCIGGALCTWAVWLVIKIAFGKFVFPGLGISLEL